MEEKNSNMKILKPELMAASIPPEEYFTGIVHVTEWMQKVTDEEYHQKIV